MNKRKALSIMGTALVLVLLLAGVLQAQGNRSVFSWVVANRATVQSGGLAVTGDTSLVDATLSDDLVVASDSTLSGDLALGGDLKLTAQSVVTITNGATLTPLGSYQPLAAAGAVGFGSITVGAAGSVLYLVNSVNQTITITDTGTLKLAGNIALGQYDALQLISDGTNWVQVAPVGNN